MVRFWKTSRLTIQVAPLSHHCPRLPHLAATWQNMFDKYRNVVGIFINQIFHEQPMLLCEEFHRGSLQLSHMGHHKDGWTMLKIWMPKFPLKYVAVDVLRYGGSWNWVWNGLMSKHVWNYGRIKLPSKSQICICCTTHAMSDDLELVGSDFYALWIFHPGKSNLQTQDLVVDYNINIRVSMTENNCSRMSTFVAVAQKQGILVDVQMVWFCSVRNP